MSTYWILARNIFLNDFSRRFWDPWTKQSVYIFTCHIISNFFSLTFQYSHWDISAPRHDLYKLFFCDKTSNCSITRIGARFSPNGKPPNKKLVEIKAETTNKFIWSFWWSCQNSLSAASCENLQTFILQKLTTKIDKWTKNNNVIKFSNWKRNPIFCWNWMTKNGKYV
jgi:hypothetical protein